MTHWWQGFLPNFRRMLPPSQEQAPATPVTIADAADPSQADVRPAAFWSQDALQLLHKYQSHRTWIAAELMEEEQPDSHVRHTLLLDFSPTHPWLWIDEVFPSPLAALRDRQLKLLLQEENRTLLLRGQLGERQPIAGAPAYPVQVIEQRWLQQEHRQLDFAVGQGPKAVLLLPLLPCWHGVLLSVSDRGFQMSVPGIIAKDLARRQGECQLHFHPLFTLKARVRVQQSSQKRKPGVHTRIQALFDDLDAVQRDQLHCFLRLCAEGESV